MRSVILSCVEMWVGVYFRGKVICLIVEHSFILLVSGLFTNFVNLKIFKRTILEYLLLGR